MKFEGQKLHFSMKFEGQKLHFSMKFEGKKLHFSNYEQKFDIKNTVQPMFYGYTVLYKIF